MIQAAASLAKRGLSAAFASLARAWRCLGVCLVAMALVGAASAETTYAPRVEQRALINTNRALQADPPEGTVYGESTDLRLGLETSGELWRLQATPRALFTRYTSDQEYDTNEYFIESAFERDFERTTIRNRVDWSRTSTLSTELFNTGGLQQRRIRNDNRYSLALGSDVTHALTERLSLVGNYSYSRVNFEDSPVNFFANYRFHSGTGQLVYQFSGTTQLFTALGYSYFKALPEVNPSRAKTWTYFAGLSHAFDDTLNASLSMGQNNGTVAVDQTVLVSLVPPLLGTQTVETSASGLFLNFEFEKRFARSTLRGSYVEQVQPSSLGGQQTTGVAQGNYSYRFDEKWSTNFNIQRRQDGAQDASDAVQAQRLQRTNLILNSTSSYRLTKEWRVIAQYQFRRLTQDTGFTAEGHLVGVALNFGAEPSLANEFWY